MLGYVVRWSGEAADEEVGKGAREYVLGVVSN